MTVRSRQRLYPPPPLVTMTEYEPLMRKCVAGTGVSASGYERVHGRRRLAHRAHELDLFHVRLRELDAARHALLQQQLGRADDRVGVEAVLHADVA